MSLLYLGQYKEIGAGPSVTGKLHFIGKCLSDL